MSSSDISGLSINNDNLLGPLTTLWTPPSQCLSTVTYTPTATLLIDGSTWTQPPFLGMGMTQNVVDLACYPPHFTTDHIYSPGICPSGKSIFLIALTGMVANIYQRSAKAGLVHAQSLGSS